MSLWHGHSLNIKLYTDTSHIPAPDASERDARIGDVIVQTFEFSLQPLPTTRLQDDTFLLDNTLLLDNTRLLDDTHSQNNRHVDSSCNDDRNQITKCQLRAVSNPAVLDAVRGVRVVGNVCSVELVSQSVSQPSLEGLVELCQGNCTTDFRLQVALQCFI